MIHFRQFFLYKYNNYIFIILVAREVFEKKRKEHYNEFMTAKILAQQLMDEEDDDEKDDKSEASLV